MKKIELIWRHILFESVEHRQLRFQQQELAHLYKISSSTVNAAMAPIRRLGGVRVDGRGFTVVDYEKILYHWANHRDMEKDIALRMSVHLSVAEIEGQLPPASYPTAYTFVRERFGEPPADYDAVYCYHADPALVQQRFQSEITLGKPNIFVLKTDPFLAGYKDRLPLSQVFVDLWNITDWYAKDFIKIIKEAIDGLLS
ncbi:hypothetical protein KKB64_02700 [Patescibacteria group bacterium]|nr:hypothetical protein [Patescibacteria group bacterium]MBU1472667.1 hypothetical protein [Patescibacteria group bacterium]MBU2459905.1 hypothetical protein [Patescibacteria group bacterium]MBU2544705.1 hypothetical protein [Patescibacteria group bacterium]